MNYFLLLVAFGAGALTLFASCVLPILPVIVGGTLSASGDAKEKIKKRLTIIISLCVSVIAFTFILKVSSVFANVPQNTWTLISGGILVLFGVLTIFPKLWGAVTARVNASSQSLLNQSFKSKSKLREVLLGAALGPVFATCSPIYFFILANILPVDLLAGFVYLLAYALGLGIALYAVAVAGDKLINRIAPYISPTHWIMRSLGVLILVVGVAIITGYDKKFELYLTSKGYGVSHLEERILALTEDDGDHQITPTSPESRCDVNTLTERTAGKELECKVIAPEFVTPDGYINTNGKPITLESLKGKVVLVEFWTYSCINCQHVIPYLNTWYEKYKDKGFVMVGVHTPEFAFEKNIKNVEQATRDMKITWPSVLDNNYQTWNAYANRYWPHKFLVDKNGDIVYHHIGEGGYAETERLIQKLLGVDAALVSQKIANGAPHTGETYFGALRNQTVANIYRKFGNVDVQYLSKDYIGLSGSVHVQDEYVEARTGKEKLHIPFLGKKALCIFTSPQKTNLAVNTDGISTMLPVEKQTLYTLYEYKQTGYHYLEVSLSKGVRVYTCVFE